MKRYIKSAKQSHPIQDLAIRKAFDRIWNEDPDRESFLESIDYGFGNADLPKALIDIEFNDLMELAEKYADYKSGVSDVSPDKFDIQGAIQYFEDFVNENYGSDGIVDRLSYSIKKGNLELFFFVTSKEYPEIHIQKYIDIKPGVPFSLSMVNKNDLENLADSIDHMKMEYEFLTLFCKKYSKLLDKFFVDYLGIPKSEYKKYLSVETFNNGRTYDVHMNSSDSGANLKTIIYDEGYSDIDWNAESRSWESRQKFNSDIQQLFGPLFESYGLDFEASSFSIRDVSL